MHNVSGVIRLPFFNSIYPKQVLFVLWFFLLLFPKGGFKIGSIPLTWGYLLLGIAFLVASMRSSWKIRTPRLGALFCLIPFQMVSAFTMILNGTGSMAWTVAFIITFFFLPYAFLFVFSNDIETMDLKLFGDLLKRGVVFVSYYGIFLFIYKQVVGRYFEIPFLTVNWGDLGVLDDSNVKCNSRGIVSKLISTYNNGQLFGISMILLLPLYCYVQKNSWHKLATKFALILTLSRTTWIGLVCHEIFYNLLIEENKRKAWKSLVAMSSCIGAGLAALAFYYRFNLSFFLDSDFGGRKGQLEVLQHVAFFSDKPFSVISEMVYMSILDSFGIIGLMTYLFAMGIPVVFHLSAKLSKAHLCIMLGLCNYLFISFSDGATLYIPVLAFFWFLLSLLGRKNLEELATKPLDSKAPKIFKKAPFLVNKYEKTEPRRG